MSGDKPGATGKFPDGKLFDSDEGEIVLGLRVADDKVIIHFGTPVGWLALLPQQLAALAGGIANLAERLPESDDQFMIGLPDNKVQKGGVLGFEMRKVKGGNIGLRFVKPVIWFALPKKHAVGLAKAMMLAVEKAKGA